MRKLLLEWVEINKFRELNKRQLNKIREDYIVFKGYKKDNNGQLSSDQEQDVQATVEKVLNTIIKEIDPTYNARKENYANQYQQWILTQFQKQPKNVAVFDEDLPKYRTQIERYIKYKLPTQITKYSTLQDLLTQLNTYEQENNLQPQKTGKTYSNIPDSLETFINNGELLFIKEFDKYMMYVPLTEEQSIQVGTDTEWCTQYTERNTLFYNYSKSPLFSIRSKTVYKDNYQFYFDPHELNLKDNQDDDIDSIKFNNEHPDIVQFFKDFINNKYEEIFNKLSDVYSNIRQDIINEIEISDWGYYPMSENDYDEDNDYDEGYIVIDEDGRKYTEDDFEDIYDAILKKYDEKKYKNKWITWDLQQLKNNIYDCHLLYSIIGDKLKNTESINTFNQELYKIYEYYKSGDINTEYFRNIIIAYKNEIKLQSENTLFTISADVLHDFINVTNGDIIPYLPSKNITKDIYIELINKTTHPYNESTLERFKNIDFKNNENSIELQKAQIKKSIYGLLAIYKQMMPSDEIFEYQISRTFMQMFLILSKIEKGKVPSAYIFELYINKFIDESTNLNPVYASIGELSILYNKYPNLLTQKIINEQYMKFDMFALYFPNVLKQQFLQMLKKNLFGVATNLDSYVKKEYSLIDYGYTQETMFFIFKTIFEYCIKNQNDGWNRGQLRYYIVTWNYHFEKWGKRATQTDKNTYKQLILTFFEEIAQNNVLTTDNNNLVELLKRVIDQVVQATFNEGKLPKQFCIEILSISYKYANIINIEKTFTQKEIYSIYKASKDKSLEIFFNINTELKFDNVIPEDELYNMIQNKDDLFMLKYFNTLTDSFLLKLYSKLYGGMFSTSTDNVDFYQHTEQLKRLLVKKEQKNLFKKLLDI